MLDDVAGEDFTVRRRFRESLDVELGAPLDPDAYKEWQHEQWGLTPEAVEHAEVTDKTMADATFEIPEG